MQTTSLRLTKEQQEAHDMILDFVENPKSRYFKLSGYAGCGKSVTITRVLETLKSKGISFTIAAPTNKAARNIERLSNFSFKASTIASLLGLQPSINEEDGKEVFSSTGNDRIGEAKVCLFEEYSMIPSSDHEEIDSKLKYKDSKGLFLGDFAQLPPVGERFSPINLAKYPEYTLSTVIRYSGDIARVAEEIRTQSTYEKRVYPFKTTTDETIIKAEYYDWLGEAVSKFKSDEFQQNYNHCRILTWRNSQADKYNRIIRKNLLNAGDYEEEQYLPGDLLIAKKPVWRYELSKQVIAACNSDEFVVVANKTLFVDKLKGWEYWLVPCLVLNSNNERLNLKILTYDSEQKRQAELQGHIARKNWKEFYKYQKMFDYISYAYAITTHRSQGSSINYPFIDTRDLSYSKEVIQPIQYTALTRTINNAYVL